MGEVLVQELKTSQQDLPLRHICAQRSLGCSPSPAPAAVSLWHPVKLQSHPGLSAKEKSPWSKPGEVFAGRGDHSSPGASMPTVAGHRLCSWRARAAGADLLHHAPSPLSIIKAFRLVPGLAYSAYYVCSASVLPLLSGRACREASKQRWDCGPVFWLQQWKPLFWWHPAILSPDATQKAAAWGVSAWSFLGGALVSGSEPCPLSPQPCMDSAPPALAGSRGQLCAISLLDPA